MRTHSQKITAERLAKALARQGVTLKRNQIIEVLAETFGLVDSNDLSAAAKRGEIDPPTAEAFGTTMANHPSLGMVPLMLLRDPSQNRIFAIDVDAVESKDKSNRFAVTPYGGIVALPETEGSAQAYSPNYSPFMHDKIEVPVLSDEDKALAVRVLSLFSRPDGHEPEGAMTPSSPEATLPVDENHLSGEARRIAEAAWAVFFERRGPMPSRYLSDALLNGKYVPDHREIIVHDIRKASLMPGFENYAHLISKDRMYTGIDPVASLAPSIMAMVDGKPFLGFAYETGYTDHLQAKTILRDLCEFRDTRIDAIARVGGVLRWNEDDRDHRFKVEILLPAELADHVDSDVDWRDAVLSLIDSPEVERCEAEFHAEAWQNDWAIGVDFEGDTKIDVAFEILTMGRKDAMAIEDNKLDSDDLKDAAKADRLVRDWSGPFRIEVADEIREFFEERDRSRSVSEMTEIVDTVVLGMAERTDAAKRRHAQVIAATVRRLEAKDAAGIELEESIDDAIDEIKGKAATVAANQVEDDQADEAIEAVETWISRNVSNAGDETRVATILANFGTNEAFRILRPEGDDAQREFDAARMADDRNAALEDTAWQSGPAVGSAAVMPDGETTVIVRECRPADRSGLWTIVDQYGEEHVVEDDDGVWAVAVGRI